MSSITLESLAQRVEVLERALSQRLIPPRPRDWRRVVGMFGESEFMRVVDAEGQAIRVAERAEAEQLESPE